MHKCADECVEGGAVCVCVCVCVCVPIWRAFRCMRRVAAEALNDITVSLPKTKIRQQENFAGRGIGRR